MLSPKVSKGVSNSTYLGYHSCLVRLAGQITLTALSQPYPVSHPEHLRFLPLDVHHKFQILLNLSYKGYKTNEMKKEIKELEIREMGGGGILAAVAALRLRFDYHCEWGIGEMKRL